MSTVNKTNILNRVWNGDVSMVVTFWVWFWAPGVVLNAIVDSIPLSYVLMFVVVSSVYFVFVLVGLYRSAKKYKGRKFWQVLVYIIIAWNWLLILSGLLQLGELLVGGV